MLAHPDTPSEHTWSPGFNSCLVYEQLKISNIIYVPNDPGRIYFVINFKGSFNLSLRHPIKASEDDGGVNFNPELIFLR